MTRLAHVEDVHRLDLGFVVRPAAEASTGQPARHGSARTRRRCRPERYLRDGVRSGHRANRASPSTYAAAGSTPASIAHAT